MCIGTLRSRRSMNLHNWKFPQTIVTQESHVRQFERYLLQEWNRPDWQSSWWMQWRLYNRYNRQQYTNLDYYLRYSQIPEPSSEDSILTLLFRYIGLVQNAKKNRILRPHITPTSLVSSSSLVSTWTWVESSTPPAHLYIKLVND